MSKTLLFITFLFLPVFASAQRANTLTDSTYFSLESYEVLPDRNFSFAQILTYTTLGFIANDSLRPRKATRYWLKLTIINPFDYAEYYSMHVIPDLNNTLYYFDANTQQWITRQAGITIRERVRSGGRMSCIFQGKTKSTLYVNVSIEGLSRSVNAFKPTIYFRKWLDDTQREQKVWIAWIAGLIVLFLFFLNNLYIYFSFRDKSVLHYLIAQLGGMVYLTAYWGFFHIIFSCPVFNFSLQANNSVYFYDLNTLLMHVGIMLILAGFVQLTRSYLNTETSLPGLDKLLKYGLYGYLCLSLVLILINVSLFNLEYYTVLYDNILVLFLFASIMYTTLTAYRRKLPAATPFLLANIFPLGFMLATPLFHMLISFSSLDNLWLPDLAVMSQALSFSIALVARIKFIRNELKAKEIETQQLAFDLREIELRHRLTELENQKISADIRLEKTRNELLEQMLEANHRELASTTLYIVQKNELLATLKTQIQDLNKQNPQTPAELKGIESLLQSNLYLDADWRKFKLHFEQVHPLFFDNLRAKHPDLTKHEIRLCAYFHLNLSTKEIASLLNIDPASVRRAKTRLYKKIAITGTGG